MARVKKQKTALQLSYTKERKRIQRQISRMTKRGYEVPTNILPKIPKKITSASVRRLQKITTQQLYKKSQYVDYSTGEILSAEEGRKIERQQAQQKARETRARKKIERSVQQQIQEAQREATEQEDIETLFRDERQQRDAEWERQRRSQDEINKRRLREDKSFREQFTQAAIIDRRIDDLLGEKEQDFPRIVQKLRDMIATAKEQDENAYYRRLLDNPDVLQTLEEVFYKPGDHVSPTAFLKFKSIISGEAMTAQDMRETEDDFDSDIGAYDIDIDERW